MSLTGRVRAALHRTTGTAGADPLAVYRAAFPSSAALSRTHARTEFTVHVRPGDEIARLRVRLPRVELRRDGAELVRLVAHGPGELFEVTELSSPTGHELYAIAADGRVSIRAAGAVGSAVKDVEVELLVWEACKPAVGTPPYIHSTLAITVEAVCRPDAPVLLTVVTPASCTPRSTQGNYALAYPSRLLVDERRTNLYYARGTARIAYRFGDTVGLTQPWLNLGRAAVSAAFIFFVAYLAKTVSAENRFLALIATFIAVAAVVWDFLNELAAFSVYAVRRAGITRGVLLGQLLVIVALGLALLALTTNPGLTDAAAAVSGTAAIVLAVAAATGLVLHSEGYWHGYVCDAEGCVRAFRIRRARPECHYTGRVFCDEHVRATCALCPHGVDLGSTALQTRGIFGTVATPCGAVPQPAAS